MQAHALTQMLGWPGIPDLQLKRYTKPIARNTLACDPPRMLAYEAHAQTSMPGSTHTEHHSSAKNAQPFSATNTHAIRVACLHTTHLHRNAYPAAHAHTCKGAPDLPALRHTQPVCATNTHTPACPACSHQKTHTHTISAKNRLSRGTGGLSPCRMT